MQVPFYAAAQHKGKAIRPVLADDERPRPGAKSRRAQKKAVLRKEKAPGLAGRALDQA
jgi:hypothetical protein